MKQTLFKYFDAFILGVPVLIYFCAYAVLFSTLSSHPAVRFAITELNQDPQLISALATPISFNWHSSFSAFGGSKQRLYRLQIPISQQSFNYRLSVRIIAKAERQYQIDRIILRDLNRNKLLLCRGSKCRKKGLN